VTAWLAKVHLTREAGDFVKSNFLLELPVFGGSESGGSYVGWFLYGVGAVFLWQPVDVINSFGWTVVMLQSAQHSTAQHKQLNTPII
jgi:hypothetical protein